MFRASSRISKVPDSPTAICVALSKALLALGSEEDEAAGERLVADIRARVSLIRTLIFGDPDKGAGGDELSPAAVEELARAAEGCEVLPLMLAQFKGVDFETRKGISQVFCYLVRNDVASFATGYLPKHTSLLYVLADGYNSPDLALHCGTLLRDCCRVPALHEALLYGPDGGLSKPLCDLCESYVHDPNFEVAADAFDTLSALLTNNKGLVFKCLNPDGDPASRARYDAFFGLYNELLQSDNYVLKRQSLKLMGEFLLDRENFRIMMTYISDRCVFVVVGFTDGGRVTPLAPPLTRAPPPPPVFQRQPAHHHGVAAAQAAQHSVRGVSRV